MDNLAERFATELSACDSILRLADDLCQRNEAKVILDRKRYATMAVASLYAKARKQAAALFDLASNGFGEDGLILGRSLVNLCIDMGYILADTEQVEARARRWIAKGRVERRRFGKRVGATPPDEDRIDWATEKALAEEWSARSIENRAKDAGLENYYNLPYRHGSSFEHSDSWSATSFLELNTNFVGMLTGPGDRLVDVALLTLAFAFAEITSLFGRFYAFDLADVNQKMETLVTTAFQKGPKQ